MNKPAQVTVEPIAVIGMACRFPGGADSPEALWRMLLEGRDAIVEMPPGRWPIDDWYDPDRSVPGKMNMRRAGFLNEDIAGFDAAFFGIAPREALSMDPQQRLLLEVAWEALENAACPADRLSGRPCGVFVGLYNDNYGLMLRGSPAPERIDGWSASGAHTSVAAGRISYFLNLTGPSIAIDTACSSSLVAVHLAVQSLQSGECELALAGGVHLLLAPETLVASTKLGATAPDGRCKAFDAAADGFGHGEGCGVVVLKRLRDALADGDRIQAVIRGSCVNQDGRSNSLTAPNGPAQEAAVRTALQRAGIAPQLVGYVEAHGTGTPLGDPIEIEALLEVLGEKGDAGDERRAPLAIGSVKTNLGHLEAAAGVAGLIKAILCVERGMLPAHLNFSELNPEIMPGDFPLHIPVQTEHWEGMAGRRIAGVSAFGFSGTNAHVVIEAPSPGKRLAQTESTAQVLPLSARTPQALAQLAGRWAEYLESLLENSLKNSSENSPENAPPSLADAACTAGAGRSHHRHRLAVCGNDARAVAAALRQAEASHAERPPRTAFLFTGQGSQYAGMTRRAYDTQPVFRSTLDGYLAQLDGLLGSSARDLLFGSASIDPTSLAQPLLLAIELALAAQWRAWGIEPFAVAGHSVGEFSAAVIAGVMSAEEALTLVATRGRLIQSLPDGGGMLAILAPPDRIEPLLDPARDGLSIAARNGPANTVVSGRIEALDALAAHCQSLGLRAVMLPVSHAFHSELLDPVLPAFEQAAAAFPARPPRIPLVSNLTGKPGQRFDAAYWRAHARQPVLFFDALQTLVDMGCDTFLEIGPQAVLSGLGSASFAGDTALRFIPSLKRGVADDLCLAQALAALYRAGATIRWEAVNDHLPRRKITTPSYPFERQQYWLPVPHTPNTQVGNHPAQLPAPAAASSTVATGTAVVFDFYDELTVVSGERDANPSEDDEGNLSFGFLSAPVPGFSWVEALFERGVKSAARELFLSSQRELKEALFAGIDFSRMRRVLDYGCGHAADLCRLAVKHPHLQLQGFTISARQVEVGSRRAERLGIAQRLRLQRSDSSAVPFPGVFDLIFGIEVTGLIADKEGLFDNIVAHLAPGGLLVIADFVSTGDAIANPETNSFTPSAAQWAELLASRRLRLVRAVDGSADVADWLVDPDFEAHIDTLVQRFKLGALTRRHLLSNENIGKALRLALMRYLLLTAQHAPHETEESLRAANEATLRAAPRYRDMEITQVRSQIRTPAGEPWQAWLYTLEWSREQAAATPAARPDSRAIAQALATSVQRERQTLAPFANTGATLDHISRAYLVEAFRALGCHDLESAARVPVIEPMRRLRDHLLDTLAAAGTRHWQTPPGADSLVDSPANQLADEALQQHPEARAELTLLRRCGPRLAEALTGRVAPLDLLFPDGDATLAEALYEHSPFSQAVQRLAGEVFQQLGQLPRQWPLAVIEIGAGTGATTAHLLPHLPASSRYLLTDISASLLARARRKFAGRELAFAPLDISRPSAVQHIATGVWDVAVAANVLHATPVLAETLSHTRELLVPGGLLLLIENTGTLDWGDLTFGLTPGMWNFRDTQLRRHALLRQAQWKTVLEEAGFEHVEILTPGEADRGGVSQQCVILAQRPAQRHWLLDGGKPALAAALADSLRTHGDTCTLAGNLSSGVSKLLDGVSDVVCLPPETSPATPANTDDTHDPRPLLEPALMLAQAVAGCAAPPRLSFVGIGAYAVQTAPGRISAPDLNHAPLAGFVRTAAAELAETRLRLIDLDPAQSSESQAASLSGELLHGMAGEIALRADGRHQPRLRPYRPTPQAGNGSVHSVSFAPEASYIVTGAFGGIGLELLSWMAERGARQLVLAVRRAASPEIEVRLASLRAQGVTVHVQPCDVSRQADVVALVQTAQAMAPLKGVFHAAGVVADASLARQDWAHFEMVFAAKVQGTQHLHAATQGLPLDHFVLFSSAASLLGPAGQANHAAACEFLGNFAHWRRQQGLPAVAIDWGAWAEVGAATVAGIDTHVERTGLIHMAPEQALRALDYTLTRTLVCTLATQPARLAVVAADWPRYLTRFPHGGIPTLLQEIAAEKNAAEKPASSPPEQRAAATSVTGAAETRSGTHGAAAGLREELAALLPLQRHDRLRETLRAAAARVMALNDPQAIDDERPLRDLGLDSLMAIELRNALVVLVGTRLPATLLFDHPSLATLTREFERNALADLFPAAIPASDSVANDMTDAAEDLDELDAQALSALLDAELKDLASGEGEKA